MIRIHGPRRYTIMAILYVLLFLNIPELHGNLRNQITFYQPYIEEQLHIAKSKADPALRIIMQNVLKHSTTIKVNGITKRIINSNITENVDTSSSWQLRKQSSITAQQFNDVLQEYNSPAAGVGEYVVQYANKQNIDAAYILYIFIRESTAGTNKSWAGYKPDGSTTHNVGNIICAGYSTCYEGFRDYTTWEEGFAAAIDNLVSYNEQNGITTIDAAIERWAPPRENDTEGYKTDLKDTVGSWRQANAGQIAATSEGFGNAEVSAPIQYNGEGKQVSTDLALTGCLGTNVRSAHNSSPALHDVTIPPHSDWSFNENWVINGDGQGVDCGVYYGGICDMAARYSNSGRKIGLLSHIARHTDAAGNPLTLDNVDPEDSVGIWSSGGRGGGDLVLENTSDKTAKLQAVIDGNTFRVYAWYE